MPVHYLLEQILNEYVEAAGLRSGEPLFQRVNSAGTAVTGRALNRYNAWAAIQAGQGSRRLSHPRWMPHLTGNRYHHIPGGRRTAGARPANGGT